MIDGIPIETEVEVEAVIEPAEEVIEEEPKKQDVVGPKVWWINQKELNRKLKNETETKA